LVLWQFGELLKIIRIEGAKASNIQSLSLINYNFR
jgi:hypothetical protein